MLARSLSLSLSHTHTESHTGMRMRTHTHTHIHTNACMHTHHTRAFVRVDIPGMGIKNGKVSGKLGAAEDPQWGSRGQCFRWLSGGKAP